jgi:hypothetical protein
LLLGEAAPTIGYLLGILGLTHFGCRPGFLIGSDMVDFFSKLLRIGDRVRVTAGTLKGLTGIIRRFGCAGNPVLAIDGLFEVMVGLKAIKLTAATVDASKLN